MKKANTKAEQLSADSNSMADKPKSVGRGFGLSRAAAVFIAAAMTVSTLGLSGCDEYLEDFEEGYEDSEDVGDIEDIFGIDDEELEQPEKSTAPSRYSPISGGDSDDGSFTLMLYICGSDLESDYGAATADINEILYGDISDDLNIIIQTGGTLEWQNDIMRGDTSERYIAKNDGLELLETDLGQLNTTAPETLTDFIGFCTQNYPAERYGLILWDHGGGSVWGFGGDSNYEGDSLTLGEFDSALEAAGTTFSFVGFDACLMGSVETMIVSSRYADYLIASENIEPGVGWYYTDWISRLSADTTAPISEIGTLICGDYIQGAYESDPTTHSTLALYDLGAVREKVLPAFDAFLGSCDTEIQSGNFNVLSAQRGKAKEVYSDTEHIDLINYASGLGTQEGDALCEALRDSMVSFEESKSNGQYTGVSVYLPFMDIAYLDTMLKVNESVNFCDNYDDFMARYANMLVGGHADDYSGMTASFADQSSYDSADEYDWYDYEYADEMTDYYSEYSFDDSELALTDMGDYYALELSPDDWDLITDIELCLYGYYDGSLIEYGMDSVYTFDDDGNLVLEFDNTWVSLNGTTVPFYAEYTEYGDDDYYYVEGSVPVEINGEEYDLILVWDADDYPEGVVAGARPVNEDSYMASKGLYELTEGDEITFLCWATDTEEGELELMYYSDPFVYDGELTISYEDVDPNGAYEVYYMLTDIYNNYYWTESVMYGE